MCGIVGGVAERSITNILIEGLKRLEYRGYDSAGLALVNQGQFYVNDVSVKLSNLDEAVESITIFIGSWVLRIPVGQPMVNPLKIMHIRIFQAMLP